MNGQMVITDHGFRYIVERLRHCRNKEPHEPSKERLKRDQCFEEMVLHELSTPQDAPQVQQTPTMTAGDPPHEFEPPQWGTQIDDTLSLGDIDVFANQYTPYPAGAEPFYASHLGINGPQVPAPTTLHPPSEHVPAHHAALQHAPATLPYGVLPSNGSPCSASGGSAHRSSVPSLPSHDSSYQTHETQDTQYTHYTQQNAVPFHHYPEDGRPEGPAGGCSSFSTSLGDIPSQHATIPRQRSSELRGVGTKPFPEDAGSNIDEEFGQFHDIH